MRKKSKEIQEKGKGKKIRKREDEKEKETGEEKVKEGTTRYKTRYVCIQTSTITRRRMRKQIVKWTTLFKQSSIFESEIDASINYRNSSGGQQSVLSIS